MGGPDMSTAPSKTLPACIARLQTDPDRRLRVAVRHVATLMKEIHGGDWRIQIDHEHGFVLVAPRLNKRGGGKS
jgi:hypothetical protein